jgi:hypothetical protein
VAVAYSHVRREWFPTEEAYIAEVAVEQRAKEVVGALEKLGIKARSYRTDRCFMSILQIDQPDLVLNLMEFSRALLSLMSKHARALAAPSTRGTS